MGTQIETRDLLAGLALFGGRYHTIGVFVDDLSRSARHDVRDGWLTGDTDRLFRVNAATRDAACSDLLGLLIGDPIGDGLADARRIFAMQLDPVTRQWVAYGGGLLRWMKERLLPRESDDVKLRDILYPRVTDAILAAERLPVGAPETRAAFLAVSALEEKIALVTLANDVEGEIARCGAVAAALSADAPLRAVRLTDLYLKHALDPSVAQKLGALALRAKQEWALRVPRVRDHVCEQTAVDSCESERSNE